MGFCLEANVVEYAYKQGCNQHQNCPIDGMCEGQSMKEQVHVGRRTEESTDCKFPAVLLPLDGLARHGHRKEKEQ